MSFLLTRIPKQLIMKHHILPSNGFIKLEFDLVHLMARLHVDEKIRMIEDSIDQ